MEHRFDELAKVLAGGSPEERRCAASEAAWPSPCWPHSAWERLGDRTGAWPAATGARVPSASIPRRRRARSGSWRVSPPATTARRKGPRLPHDDEGERGLLPGHGRLLWDGLLPDRSDVLQRELLQRGPDLPGWAVCVTTCLPGQHRHVQRPQCHVRLQGGAGAFLLPGHRGLRELLCMLQHIVPALVEWVSFLCRLTLRAAARGHRESGGCGARRGEGGRFPRRAPIPPVSPAAALFLPGDYACGALPGDRRGEHRTVVVHRSRFAARHRECLLASRRVGVRVKSAQSLFAVCLE
jgi:hypothetical protein